MCTIVVVVDLVATIIGLSAPPSVFEILVCTRYTRMLLHYRGTTVQDKKDLEMVKKTSKCLRARIEAA